MNTVFHSRLLTNFFEPNFFSLLINMSKKYIFTSGNEYLGPDRLTMSQSYNAYIEKCDEFIAKTKKYKAAAMQRKRSVIHSNLRGYTSDEYVEEEELKERGRAEKAYRDCFDIIKSDDKNALFENSRVKTERIRIIRELTEGKEMKCESLIPVGQSWFLRFYHLSKFIQVVRTTVLKLRLEKRLKILKRLVSEAAKKPEPNEGNISVEDHEKSLCECSQFGLITTPCNR